MSTERKPGSRGATDPFTGERANQASRIGSAPGTRQNTKTKGSTKTASPKQAFKKRRNK